MTTLHETDITSLNQELASASPKQIIKKALELFPEISISFSGAEDVVLLELAKNVPGTPRVFTLDTGRLHQETYAFLEKVRKHYNIELEVLFPEAQAVEALVKAKGLFSFYEDGHSECCGVRKVAPLRKRLQGASAWMTGQRKDQSPGTRSNVAIVELDEAFGTPEAPLIKFNPLANWSSEEVWNYIRMMDVPYNALHEKGFVSIGCAPCTRPVLPNQHEREGRWWWEEATQKECGLHIGNVEGK